MIFLLDRLRLETLTFPPDLPNACARAFEEELQRPWSRIWCIEEEGTLVAFLSVWFVADEVHVIDVATAVSHRRRGLARALLFVMFDETKKQHSRLAVLEVRRSNVSAIALYRAFGFYAAHLRPAYYADGEDGVEMHCVFDVGSGAVVVRGDEV